MSAYRKPRLGVFKFASCDGCQLSLLDCEDELLGLVEHIDIAYFPEASRNMQPGPYDISLVEGSVTTEHDAERIRRIRANSDALITIGACATAGGIQALKNYADKDAYINQVYANPGYISTLNTSTPISQHVEVDYELHGCPIDKHQLLEVVLAFAQGRRPAIPNESVCMSCKARGTVCVMVTRDEACLGPVTHAGCGALCPTYGRPCFGCYGERENANATSLFNHLHEKQARTTGELGRQARTFVPESAVFKAEAARWSESDDGLARRESRPAQSAN